MICLLILAVHLRIGAPFASATVIVLRREARKETPRQTRASFANF
jgi:hypothetical protein